MSKNFTIAVMVMASIAHLAQSATICTQEKPIHPYILDTQESVDETTYLESY